MFKFNIKNIFQLSQKQEAKARETRMFYAIATTKCDIKMAAEKGRYSCACFIEEEDWVDDGFVEELVEYFKRAGFEVSYEKKLYRFDNDHYYDIKISWEHMKNG